MLIWHVGDETSVWDRGRPREVEEPRDLAREAETGYRLYLHGVRSIASPKTERLLACNIVVGTKLSSQV